MAISLWDVLAPSAADIINLVTNPSAELGTTGYVAGTGTLTQDSTQQRRGVFALKYVPGAGVNDGLSYNSSTLINGHIYSLSVDLLGANTIPYTVFVTRAGITKGTPANITGTGLWTRLYSVFTADANSVFVLQVTKNNSADTSAFWTDGWQLVDLTAASLTQAQGLGISYIDGDQTDCYWQAAPHASQSVGPQLSRNVGIWTNLNAYNMIARGFVGLGMPPAPPIVLEYGQVDGGFYQTNKAKPRPFMLNTTMAIPGNVANATLLAMHKNRRSFIDAALKPDAAGQRQQVWLRYGFDSSFNLQRPLKIKAAYDSGYEMNYVAATDSSPGFVTDDDVKFVAADPYLYEDGNGGFAFTSLNVVSGSNANAIAYAPVRAQWNNLNSGVGGTSPAVRAILFNPYDGRFYIGYSTNTSTSNLTGTANTAGIAAYDPVANVVSPLGTGCTLGNVAGNGVYALTLAPNGDVWAGGWNVSNFGGVTNTQNIARWSLASGAWQSVATTGTGALTDIVNSIAIFADGTTIAAGIFTSMGGTAAANIALSTTFGTWAAMGTGASASVQALAIGLDNNTLYIGGLFVTINGITVNKIATWNKATATFAAMGTGANNNVRALVIGLNGTLYIGGNFSTLNGVTCNGVGAWNGTQFSPLGSGQTTGTTWKLFVEPGTGNIHVAGSFSAIGGLTVPNGYAIWNGATYVMPDIIVPGGVAATIYGLAFDIRGNRMIGFDQSGATLTSAPFQTLLNPATAIGHLVAKFFGPGSLWQFRNASTGSLLSFANLTLATGEIATLTLSPLGVTFISNFRGNIYGTIMPGSNQDTFVLLPALPSGVAGTNILEVLMTGTSGASACTVQWPLAHWSIDAADQN